MFIQHKNMRAHRRVSHEEVRFVCPYRSCEGKAFKHNCTLKKHIAREHPNGEEKVNTHLTYGCIQSKGL